MEIPNYNFKMQLQNTEQPQLCTPFITHRQQLKEILKVFTDWENSLSNFAECKAIQNLDCKPPKGSPTEIAPWNCNTRSACEVLPPCLPCCPLPVKEKRLGETFNGLMHPPIPGAVLGAHPQCHHRKDFPMFYPPVCVLQPGKHPESSFHTSTAVHVRENNDTRLCTTRGYDAKCQQLQMPLGTSPRCQN